MSIVNAETLVATANAATTPAVWLKEPHLHKIDANFSVMIQAISAHELTSEQRTWIFELFAQNMRKLYQDARWTWNETEKQQELFDETSRFIIVTSGDITAPLAVQGLGYAMYRFDTEEQMTSTDMIPVVYCYELQVSATVQGRGIGRLLVETLLQIGKVWHMQKIMLTVLKNNTPALAFYKKLKFKPDEISPDQVLSRSKAKKYSYYILSRPICS